MNSQENEIPLLLLSVTSYKTQSTASFISIWNSDPSVYLRSLFCKPVILTNGTLSYLQQKRIGNLTVLWVIIRNWRANSELWHRAPSWLMPPPGGWLLFPSASLPAEECRSTSGGKGLSDSCPVCGGPSSSCCGMYTEVCGSGREEWKVRG